MAQQDYQGQQATGQGHGGAGEIVDAPKEGNLAQERAMEELAVRRREVRVLPLRSVH